jgi:hypothetical protein
MSGAVLPRTLVSQGPNQGARSDPADQGWGARRTQAVVVTVSLVNFGSLNVRGVPSSRKRAVLSTLAVLAVLSLAAVLIVVIDPGARGGVTAEPDSLLARIETFTDAMNARQPYRPPSLTERATAARGFAEVIAHNQTTDADLTGLGFGIADLVDPQTHRPYTLIQNQPGTDRAWGMYLVDRSAPPSLAVEVPHPAFDLHSELFGLDLFRRTPGAILMVAGAHRRADGNQADVAHDADSMFQVVATYLAGRGLAQVQMHGFDNESAPGFDIVLSTGVTPAGPPAIRAGAGFRAAGFATCQAWAQACVGLEGTTNVQGQLAKTDGTTFLHVEMSRTIRDNNASPATVGQLLAAARINQS